jgi:hypothetical protein
MSLQYIPRINIFLSYSYDSPSHKEWVGLLADRLEEISELHVTWDGYDLDTLVDKNLWMESGIYESDYILVVSTEQYRLKANGRRGGVGIETYLTCAQHWDKLENTKKTNVINILREKDSTPNYLKGHLYFDFTEDSLFEKSLVELLKCFSNKSMRERPSKSRSLDDEFPYSFTRTEELIRLGHANRSCIIDNRNGVAESPKIKYQLWKTQAPAINYYLALAEDILIGETIRHAIGQLKLMNILPPELTILRPRSGYSIDKIFIENGMPKIKIHDFTYKDYIWQFCIDETFKKMQPPSGVPYYTNQPLSHASSNYENLYDDSARDFLVNCLQKPSSTAGHLVVAQGGMGKTSLCLAVAKTLHTKMDQTKSSVVLIQAEPVKRYISESGNINQSISTIYELYEIYERYKQGTFRSLDFQSNLGVANIFDKNMFELAFLGGNLVVIIDGLDEFVSLFPETFKLPTFLESLANFHKELGSSSVLITTRDNNLIDDKLLADLRLEKHLLLGFDIDLCERFLRRRFRKYDDGTGKLAKKVLEKIENVKLKEPNERVVPFFADIAATVTEDSLQDKIDDEFEILEDPTPYPSSNVLTDHIIYSVLRREEIRHGLDISVTEVMQLLCSLVADYSEQWPRSEMFERLSLMYADRAEQLFATLTLNPLLLPNQSYIELRYSFLSSYFEVILVLQGITRHSLEFEFIKALGRLTSDAIKLREVAKYFSSKRQDLLSSASKLIQNFQSFLFEKNGRQKENYQQAISSLLCLCSHVAGGSSRHVTDMILNIYNIKQDDGSPTQIRGLYIHGDFPSIDFTDLVIVDSRFSSYKKFLSSKFSNTRFISCKFDKCYNNNLAKSSNLNAEFIDITCDIGDLKEFIAFASRGKEEEIKLVESEAKKFLRSFFTGDRFTDNNKQHIRFSTKVVGLSEARFDRLIAGGYICIKVIKVVDRFYEINPAFKKSVRMLLTNNLPDAQMRKFIQFIQD